MTAFLKAAGIRAVRTFAQTAVALAPASAVAFGSVDWLLTASTALTAAVISVLTSVATGLPELSPVDTPGRHTDPQGD